MGLFSRDDNKRDTAADLRAEHDRLDRLPLDELADEILARAFGPGTGHERHRMPIRDIYALYDPSGTGSFPGLDLALVLSVQFLVEEGLQRLVQSGVLVMMGYRSDTSATEFHLSRAGRQRLGV